MNEQLVDYDKHIKESLQDPKFLEEYLNEALKEEDPRVLLIALKHIVESRKGGISAYARKTGLSRQTLYKTLSWKGNPTFNNLHSLLYNAGFHLKVEAIKPQKTKKPSRRKKPVTA